MLSKILVIRFGEIPFSDSLLDWFIDGEHEIKKQLFVVHTEKQLVLMINIFGFFLYEIDVYLYIYSVINLFGHSLYLTKASLSDKFTRCPR